MKKTGERKNLTLSKETLRNLEPSSLEKVAGGIPPLIIVTIVIIRTTMLHGDTPSNQ
jgi:hypothetical protein